MELVGIGVRSLRNQRKINHIKPPLPRPYLGGINIGVDGHFFVNIL